MRTSKRPRAKRGGNIALLSLFLLVIMLSVVALAVDIGYFQVASTELQRSADSAAIAATWKLLDEMGPNASVTPATLSAVRSTASQYAGFNQVASAAPNLAEGDVQIGHLAYPFSSAAGLTFGDPDQFNAVAVSVRRTADNNGELPTFFAKVMGRMGVAAEAQATAAFVNNVAGFRPPATGENLDILPFTLDEDTWNNRTSGDDLYHYDPDSGQVTAGSDGIPEVDLYPHGTGPPGNRGTLDIGSPNNSTADICRQIRYGITAEDLSYIDGEIRFDPETVTLSLNGDTGISAGVKDDLASVIGQPRVIPIFRTVSGPGNNATYTIVRFVGVRVMYVKLTGSLSQKKVLVQPAPIIIPGVIPGNDTPTSDYVYSPVWLVR